MTDYHEHMEMNDAEQLRLQTDIRRALLEEAAVPDAHQEFLKFKYAHTPRMWNRSLMTALAAAACVLAVVLIAKRLPSSGKGSESLTVYAGNTVSEKEVSIVVGGEAVALTTPKAKAHGVSIDNSGEVHISPSTPVADEDRATLLVPQGRVARLMLSDGTRVWLSADSRLVFPSRFLSNGPREVALVGEGYFEVARDEARPFVVNCGSMQTRVLGTAFNVRNFETEPTEVMLLKGTVSVSTARGDSLLLVPGRAASLGSDGTLSVSDADADVVTSWMRGEFYFDGQTLREIMIAIGRWYNKSVVFSGAQHLDDRLHFSSERTLPLTEIIRQLNDISNVQIAIEGDVLRVY